MTTNQIQMLVQHASEEMKKRGVDSKSGDPETVRNKT